MTPRDQLPVNRCAVRGCPFIGHWPEGECCPEHRLPHTDKPTGRAPTLAEAWDADDGGEW